MTLLLSALWPGLAGAALLGLLVGALTGLPTDRIGILVLACLGLALAALAGLAFAQSLPGKAGLRTETAGLMLAAYLAGCVIAGLGRTILARR